MIHRTLTLAVLLLALSLGRHAEADDAAQTDAEFIRMMNPPGHVVILGSGHDYAALLKQAQAIGRKSGVKLSLMGRAFDPKKGWASEDEGDGVGGYFLRNAIDGGEQPFISIEQSDAYPGLRKGYFIIVGGIFLSSGETAASLAKFKRFVPQAYAPAATIYIGCRH